MRQIRIGDITIDAVVEREGPWRRPQDFFPAYDEAIFQRNLPIMEPEVFDAASGKMCITYQTFVVRSPRHTILVDTCTGEDKGHPAPFDFPGKERWRNELFALGVSYEKIDFVFCTHLHIDHTGWNTTLRDGRWVPTFPNAKYLFSRADDAYWDLRKNPVMATDPRHMAYEDSVLPVVQSGQAVLVDDGYDVTAKLSVEAAPGHSPGHVLFKLADGGQRAVFCGDVIHHALQVYAPHWNHMADEAPADAAVSRRRLLETCAEHDALLFPIHFGAPHVVGIGHGPQSFSARFVQGST
jgi:glyoxylase-like metal-dependent hydrolase (beta-lactamase superfamily II)